MGVDVILPFRDVRGSYRFCAICATKHGQKRFQELFDPRGV
jgi:hypothetical protein